MLFEPVDLKDQKAKIMVIGVGGRVLRLLSVGHSCNSIPHRIGYRRSRIITTLNTAGIGRLHLALSEKR